MEIVGSKLGSKRRAPKRKLTALEEYCFDGRMESATLMNALARMGPTYKTKKVRSLLSYCLRKLGEDIMEYERLLRKRKASSLLEIEPSYNEDKDKEEPKPNRAMQMKPLIGGRLDPGQSNPENSVRALEYTQSLPPKVEIEETVETEKGNVSAEGEMANDE